ncbi:MAG: nuclear transport factor 2 family protein [Myxococcota bacterium]|nr:nuclear transport factor 2 family protein [Myxococcota bacterium]
MSQSPIDLEANKRLASDFIDALSSGDAGRILDLYTEDATVWTAGSLPISGTHPREAVVALCEGLLGAFPKGLRFEVVAMTAEGNRVAIEAEGHGLHASGQPYHQQYHFLLVVRDGKLSEIKEYFDTEHARQVLIPGDA